MKSDHTKPGMVRVMILSLVNDDCGTKPVKCRMMVLIFVSGG